MVEYTLKGIPQKNICMEGFDGVVWLEWLVKNSTKKWKNILIKIMDV
jgi:hypothetical protein